MDEVPAPVVGMFYQAVIAAVLLYGSELWILPPSGLKVLEGFPRGGVSMADDRNAPVTTDVRSVDLSQIRGCADRGWAQAGGNL